MNHCSESFAQNHTDQYFRHAKVIIERFGDVQATYAIFMRRPVISAPKLMMDWLYQMAKLRNTEFQIHLCYEEGRWVGAGEPILYLRGALSHLVDLETLFLQRLGPACVAAWNAYNMCMELPNVEFIAMDARHCAGQEMAEFMAYAASVGSERAKTKGNAKGFIGTTNDQTAHYFGLDHGLGTMPHALIGYAGSTLQAAKMFHETFSTQPLTVLVDYFGREISDSLEICQQFPDLAANGRLALRLDTPGSRYGEFLDPSRSYEILERHVPSAIRGYRLEEELKFLIGPGVSAAAVWFLRDALNDRGFDKVKIVASSGFSPEKCRVFAMAQTPVDRIGTGSYLPEKWNETYATADIIEYGDTRRVKVGREFLFPKQPLFT